MPDHSAESAQAQGTETIRHGRNIAYVGLGSALSAVAVYIVMAIGARALPGADRSTLLVFIAGYQIVTGVLAGVTTELTRSLASARSTGRTNGPRVVSVLLVVSIALAVSVAASAPLWSHAFPSHRGPLVAAVVCTAAGFAGHAALAGSFSGRAEWTGVAMTISLEAAVRLALSVAAAVFGLGLGGFAGATAAAAFAWLLLPIASSSARAAFSARTDVSVRLLARRLAASIGALSANALLMAGFPMLLSLTTPDQVIRQSAGLLQAVSLTRAPLLVPLTAFQTMLITAFVNRRDRPARTLAILAAALGSVSTLGALLAWAIGPWLMRLLFTYEVSGPILGTLTLASGLLAGITICGSLCQALERHASFLLGWGLACIVSFGMLLIPAGIETRTILSLIAGPAAGLAVMTPAILSASAGRKR